MICQHELNEMLRVNDGKLGSEFCEGVLNHLGITYTVDGAQNLPSSPRVMFVCNHPLGGLDGMILINLITRHYGKEPYFLVNDLLMAIEPLRGIFLPVNKHGSQSRRSLHMIDEAMKSERPVIIFPAGLCSRRLKGGVIADLEWQKTFVNRAIASHRDIIPLHFSGTNSKFFYNFAKIRSALGIPFNLEMLRLPAEIFRARGKRFLISAGTGIPYETLRGGIHARECAESIREAVYHMA